MNDSELEDQLRALPPAAPSADLAKRIARDLAATSAGSPAAGVIARPARARFAGRWLHDLGWAAAGAAATLGGIALFSTPDHPARGPVTVAPRPQAVAPAVMEAAADQAFEPAASSRELVAVKNSDELLETANGTVREVRYTYREHLTWAHPKTGARLEIEVPREDVYLLPVSLQ